MGASSSTSNDPITDLYRRYATVGGDDSETCSCKIGGLDDTKGYVTSTISKAKQHLIKDIAEEMFHKLKIANVPVKNASLDEIIQHLKKYVPDPRKGTGNGKSIGDNAEKQIKICKTLAAIINDKIGAAIIDLDAKPGEICEAVAEVMDNLTRGFSAEFTAVRDDVKRLLKNIHVLEEMLERQHRALDSKIARDTSDSTIAAETSVLRRVHNDVMMELKRQTTMLELILDEVVKPTEMELEKILKESGDFKNLVKKIKQYPGNMYFGQKVSFALSGVRNVAQAAKLVDEALKVLGIKYAEYAKITTPKELKEMLSQTAHETLKDTEENLAKYEKARQILYNHQWMKDDIMKRLEESSKKGAEESDEYGNGSGDGSSSLEDGLKVGGAKLDKRVKKRAELKKALLKNFSQRLNVVYDRILVAAESLGKQIGSGKLPLSDALEKFPKAIDQIPDVQKSGVFYALSGIVNDTRSREERESFVSVIRYIVATLDDILKDSNYSKNEEFKEMKRGYEEMIKLIDDFSSKFTEGFGILPPYKKRKGDVIEGAAEGEDCNRLREVMAGIGKFARDAVTNAPQYTKNIGEAAMNVASSAGEVASSVRKSGLFGADEDNIEPEAVNIPGFDESADEPAGASVRGGDGDAEITRMAYQFSRLREIILYYFRIARIRVNLGKASEEMKAYGEDYTKILADAVASSVDDCTKKKNEWRKKCEEENGIIYTTFVDKTAADGDPKGKLRLQHVCEMKCKAYDTQIEMYRTAEAVDLYMKHFTSAITSHPDDLRNILKILNSTEVISKWFSDKSGDLLCHVFDSFPASFEHHVPKYNRVVDNSKASSLSDYHYYARIATLCRLGRINELKQDVPALVTGPINTWVDFQGPAGLNLIKVADEIIGNTPLVTANASLPGIPFLAIPPYSDDSSDENTGEKALKWTEKALSVNMLKNIINVFVTVGSTFGGEDLTKKVHKSPIQLFKSLTNYMVQSSFSMGTSAATSMLGMFGPFEEAVDVWTGDVHQNPAGAVVPPVGSVSVVKAPGVAAHPDITGLNFDIVGDVDAIASTAVSVRNDERIRVGMTADLSLNGDPKNKEKRLTYMAMRRAGDVAGMPFSNDFEKTDLLFVLSIKAIVAKILVAIGTYNMFHRPINKDGLGYFSGLRVILGGAAEVPKIIPEALELYIRLPLLAEFYRNVLDFDSRSTHFRAISMVPEMDGVFSGIIGIIFDKASYVENGNYSETDIRAIIEEINKIWIRFKDRKNMISDIIHEFISEVNRRIGVYKREEREGYLKERRERYKKNYRDLDELTNFSLNGIDEDDDYPRPAPSMSYQTEGGLAGTRAHKYKLDTTVHMKDVRELRDAIDKIFKEAESSLPATNLETLITPVSFDGLLRARKEELKHAKSEKEKFDIVHSAIVSLGSFSSSALERSLILFHEVVIAPLNTLYATFTVLKRFSDDLQAVYGFLKKAEALFKADPSMASYNNLRGRPEFVSFLTGAGDFIENQGSGHIWRNVSDTDLTAIINEPSNAREKDFWEVLYRFAIDQDQVLAKTLELLFSHASTFDKLIEFRMNVEHDAEGYTCQVNVQLDHSKLRQAISNIFNGVKQSLDKFRGLLPKDIINKYETHKNEGSLYWIEEKLIDELLDGKYENEPQGEAIIEKPKGDNLDRCNMKFNHIFAYLTRDWGFNARGFKEVVVNIGSNKLSDIDPPWREIHEPRPTIDLAHAGYEQQYFAEIKKKSRHAFAFTIDDFVFYNITNASGVNHGFPNIHAPQIHTYTRAGAVAPTVAKYSPHIHKGILKLLFNTSGKPKDGVADGVAWKNSPFRVRNGLYDFEKGFVNDENRGVFVTFNRLIAAYLNQIYDYSYGKVYLTTLNEFANGPFSAAIFGDAVYTDTDVHLTNDLINKSPVTNGVLLKSLAVIINQILSEKTLTGDKKQHLETDISEIPLYIKESLKANLPIFQKLFGYLIDRCNILKNVVRALNIVRELDSNAPAHRESAPHRSDVENKQNMMKILDEIINGSTALIQCIKTTLSDLSDDPKYFETHNGSISEYESINGMEPFMPLSSTEYYLRDDTNVLDNIALPIYKLGDPKFKINYGVRKIFNVPEIKLTDMPGMIALMKEHNQSSDIKHHFDEKHIDSLLTSQVCLSRYLTDLKKYRSNVFSTTIRGRGAGALNTDLLLSHGNVKIFNLATPSTFDKSGMAVYSLRAEVNLLDVVRMTESNFQAEQRKKITVLVENQDPCKPYSTRQNMLVYNIIDLNVVPINVHALQREIPLVNLYNYSWTFDKIMCELFELKKVHSQNMRDTITENDIESSSKKLLGFLLLNPYGEIDNEIYHRHLPKILRGDLGIEGLGRPKYLSDEVYGKALFGELYSDEEFKEEGGPGVGDGRQRGTERVLQSIMREGAQLTEILKKTVFRIMVWLCSDKGGAITVFNAFDEDVIREAVDYLFGTLVDAKTSKFRPGVDSVRVAEIQAILERMLNGMPTVGDPDDARQLTIAALVVLIYCMSDAIKDKLRLELSKFLAFFPGKNYNLDHAALTELVGRNINKRDNFITHHYNMIYQFLYNSRGGGEIVYYPHTAGSDNTYINEALQSINDYTKDMNVAGFRPINAAAMSTYQRAGRPLSPAQGDIEYFMEIIGLIPKVNNIERQYIDNRSGFFDGKMHYLEMGKNGETQIKHVDVGEYKSTLQQIGKLRFDTMLTRNIFWLTNIQRALRLKLRRDLTWFDQNVVGKHAVTASGITELFGNDLQAKDFPKTYRY